MEKFDELAPDEMTVDELEFVSGGRIKRSDIIMPYKDFIRWPGGDPSPPSPIDRDREAASVGGLSPTRLSAGLDKPVRLLQSEFADGIVPVSTPPVLGAKRNSEDRRF